MGGGNMGEAEQKCPKCGSTEFAKLASSVDVQRYQCGKCLEEFAVLADRPNPVESKSEELRSMGKGKEFCAKGCGKSFGWMPAKSRHEKACPGPVDNDGSVDEEPTLPKIRAMRKRAPKVNGVNGVSATLMRAIAELEEKKTFHQAEALKLESAIATLKTVQ